MRRTAALMAGASLAALLASAPAARANECAPGAPPADVASPASLYEQLRARTDAQLLSIGFLNKPVADTCAWIYEVKVVTVSGSVVELDFAASSLALVGARGPRDDGEAAALVRGLGADGTILVTGSDAPSSRTSNSSGADPDGGGEGGSGGGSGSGGSGSGGSGSGGGSGEGGSDGGGDGDSGEGGGSDGGGDSGDGGSDDSGSGGGDSGGDGGSGEGGESGDD